ncbi:hypothetical protein FXO38_32323 [Capsicum annuum]|nr:hypothetical protein FXO38_32323 [Capsicum annuum]
MKSFLVNAPRTEERRIGSAVWNSWKSRSLSYLLDKRTIRLVSVALVDNGRLWSSHRAGSGSGGRLGSRSGLGRGWDRDRDACQITPKILTQGLNLPYYIPYQLPQVQVHITKDHKTQTHLTTQAVGVQEEFEGHVEGGYGYGARGNGPRDQGGYGGHDMGLNSIKVTRPSFQRDSDLDGYLKRESQCDRIFQANDLPDVKKKTYAIAQFEGYALTWRE